MANPDLTFTKRPNHYILLVPHVIPVNMPVENDLEAWQTIWDMPPMDVQEKVLVLDGNYD
ncbi:MAG: hypothetical protein JRE23_14400 [Deltaproteobacteria bacterium]|nr:hypothetical protein [Deltaproteobacteria bacterium]